MAEGSIKALILAGGKGTRLRPYTTVLPKPLMPVGDLPILEIILRQLKQAGITEVILAVGYMSQLFQTFFQDGSRLGLKITYSFEEHPLGTAGPISVALDQLGEHFIVMNGDLLTTLNYRRLFESHLSSGAAATIGTYKREVKIDFGVLNLNSNNELESYVEKPTYHFNVSMGVNVFDALAVSRFLVPGKYLDIPELMMNLKAEGLSVGTYQESCRWLDIGRVEDYRTAIDTFEAHQAEFFQGDA